jgi:hypothetical protein
MLADFINNLPAGLNHWYQQPSGLVSKGGELFLPGTENLPGGCSRNGNGNGEGGRQGGPTPAPGGDGGGGGGGGGD